MLIKEKMVDKEQINKRLRDIEEILKPAACFLGGLNYHVGKSVNCVLEPERDAKNSVIKAGVEIHELRQLISRDIDEQEEKSL